MVTVLPEVLLLAVAAMVPPVATALPVAADSADRPARLLVAADSARLLVAAGSARRPVGMGLPVVHLPPDLAALLTAVASARRPRASVRPAG